MLFDRQDEDRREGGDNREEMTCAEDLDFQEQGPGEGRTGLQWCRMGVRGVGDVAEEEGEEGWESPGEPHRIA